MNTQTPVRPFLFSPTLYWNEGYSEAYEKARLLKENFRAAQKSNPAAGYMHQCERYWKKNRDLISKNTKDLDLFRDAEKIRKIAALCYETFE